MTEPHVAVLSQVQQFLDRQHGLYIDGRPGPAQSEPPRVSWRVFYL